MKRGALRHFKTGRLAAYLSEERPCDRAEALGILEALFRHVVPEFTPRGDLGRLTDEEIAESACTTRNPAVLVRSLIRAGWLEEHPEHRLLVHDYAEHADNGVRSSLRFAGLDFIPSPKRRNARGSLNGHSANAQGSLSVRSSRKGKVREGSGTGLGNGSGDGGVGEESGFDRFWKSYPRKLDKRTAQRAWAKLAPGPELLERICAAVTQAKGTADWRREGGRFIPYPATWLNGGRWEDEGTDVPAERWTSSKTSGNLAAAENAIRRIQGAG